MYQVSFGRTPHPVIVTIRDNKDYIRVLFYSYSTTITGWGVLLRYRVDKGRHFPYFGGPGRLLCSMGGAYGSCQKSGVQNIDPNTWVLVKSTVPFSVP